MIEIRKAETDADLDAWREVRRAVLPNERAPSVEELRSTMTPEKLLAVARIDGRVVGNGLADRSETGGSFVLPRVLPEARRRGVGTALLRALVRHARALGFPTVGSRVEEEDCLVFAERFGFRETRRDVEQVRVIGDEHAPQSPEGIVLISLADDPELFERTYNELAVEALQDLATDQPLEVSLEDWRREWVSWPEGSFVALEGDEIVACAGLMRDADRPDRAENSLTAVRRDRRGRGLASLVKRAVLAWAADNGIREIYTWTQTGNEGMRRVNERLGYEYRSVSITVRAPLETVRERLSDA